MDMTQTMSGPVETTERTGWTGWISFAGIMLVIGGVLQAFYGLLAIFNDDWAVWGREGVLFVDLTGWGWAHLIIGALVALCGVGLFTGNMAARIVGVLVAAVSLLVNFFFIPVAPFWALTVIVIDALVIWAITVHGREMKAA